jgi:hypothetical protein
LPSSRGPPSSHVRRMADLVRNKRDVGAREPHGGSKFIGQKFKI